jgi:hypothetical protein
MISKPILTSFSVKNHTPASPSLIRMVFTKFIKFNSPNGFRRLGEFLATEIVEHLRAALDHATWATAWLKTGDPYIEQVAFPVAKTAADLDNSMRRRSKNLPPEIQAMLRTFQPYEGGNDALYTLNVLCNTSKHALVAFIAAAVFDFQISGTAAGIPKGIQFPEPTVWDSEKNEIVYARVRLGSTFDHQAKFKVFVALQHKEAISPIPATAALDGLHSETKRIVLAIEAESRRIGLIQDLKT